MAEEDRFNYRIPFKYELLPSCRTCRYWGQEKLREGCTYDIEGGDLRWEVLRDIMSDPNWGHCLLTMSEDDLPKPGAKAWARDNEGMFAVLQTYASFSCCQFQEKEKEDG